jgi:hypothetical protein
MRFIFGIISIFLPLQPIIPYKTEKLIGRKEEKALLERLKQTTSPAFVAIKTTSPFSAHSA